MPKVNKEKFKESRLIAKMLTGSWRKSPPPIETSLEELETALIPLQNVHGCALAWWRIKDTELKETAVAQKFYDAFRFYSVSTRARLWQIQQALSLLRSENIEPVLVKGWAINRLYPSHALRFFSDNDLLIHPAQFKRAREILSSFEGPALSIDSHKGTSNDTTKELDIEPFEKLFERSQIITLEDFDVRVLCPEDHLRLIVTHWLQDGAERASGLCDIALMIETYKSNFDWEICLTKNKRRAGWVTCSIELARQLFDADVSKLPNEARCKKMPRWILPAVLKAWTNHVIFAPLENKSPIAIFTHIRKRFPPNPIRATVRLNCGFNHVPRLPYQIANVSLRSIHFLKEQLAFKGK
jgi:hypothetical protein